VNLNLNLKPKPKPKTHSGYKRFLEPFAAHVGNTDGNEVRPKHVAQSLEQCPTCGKTNTLQRHHCHQACLVMGLDRRLPDAQQVVQAEESSTASSGGDS